LDTVILARVGGAELAAIIGGIVFLALMAFLLFGGSPEPKASAPKPDVTKTNRPKRRR
jgi:L-lactate permease